MRDDFAVFILSHGRAKNMVTLKPLLEGGYTGKWYIVIDNEDKTADEYYEMFGDHVIMFDKLAKAREIDAGDNFDERRAILYARHACFDIAERLGIEYFLELDDDYSGFYYRWAEGESLKAKSVKNLDRVFNAMIDFLEDTGALTVAFAQAGDFLGGVHGGKFKQGLLRKAMNTFFFKTKNRVNFTGKQNEDVSTYVRLGSIGHLLFTVTAVAIVQSQTQSLAGGMSELYKDNGTYLKSFYTIMYCPSSVKVAMMGQTNMRIHHRVNWRCAVPKIISEDFKIMTDL